MPSLTVTTGGFAARIRCTTVFVGGHAFTDFGLASTWAKLDVDRTFCEKLLDLLEICREQNLSEVRMDYTPACWGPECDINVLCLANSQLVVSRNEFWFASRITHEKYIIETKPLKISRFIADVCRCDEPLFLEVTAVEVLS